MKKFWMAIILTGIIIVSCAPKGKENQAARPESIDLLDIQLTAYQEYKKAEGELDKLYNQILKEYSDEPFFKSKIEKVELAWLDFKEAQLDFLFPGEEDVIGEVNSTMYYWLSMKELTEARITLLRIWLMELSRVGVAVED